ncbi:MAG: superoxide dismutase [Myxococcales bacterium]|nr:superoxide dismutase [Myxococcales bacterium]
MKSLCIVGGLVVLSLLAFSSSVYAHCQVPCGIYDDHARVHVMEEDSVTIEKATRLIGELTGLHDATSHNQLVRWVKTKEEHANRIISVTAEYFLTQKIKPADPKDEAAWKNYILHLTTCHKLMRAAMKVKQTVSQENVDALKKAISALGALYPAK